LKENGKNTLCEIIRQKIGTNSTTKLISEKRSISLYPSLTPDGSGYIYCSNRINGKYALWLRKFKGTARSRLSKGLNQDFSSSVSPNGSKVVFTSIPSEGEELEIWTLDVNSGLPSQLGTGYDPQVSPNGKTIMFLLNDPESKRSHIWTMDFDGGDRTQLTSSDTHDIRDPRWSPDGKVIVFASNEGKDDKGRQNFDIWMMNADGSKLKQLTMNGSHDDKPCFDRHGEQVYFRSNRGTKWNIWSLKLGERYSDKKRTFEM
jgi:Tol biopolymer transport system component